MSLVVAGSEPSPPSDPSPPSLPPRGRLPRPPRRPPAAPRPPLTTQQAVIRGILLLVASLVVMFVLSILVFGHISYRAAQQQLEDRFTAELGTGTAPVSEGDFEDKLLPDGGDCCTDR